jgi:hypothetical protein
VLFIYRIDHLIFVNAQTMTLTFDDGTSVDADDIVGGSSAQSVAVDPTDPTNKVLSIRYVPGASWNNWGGFLIPEGEALMKTDSISFRWTPEQIDQGGGLFGKTNSAGDFGYLFKLEGSGGSTEKAFLVNGTGSWQTITLDFSTCDDKPVDGKCNIENAEERFNKLILHHWGGSNPSSALPETIYIDDLTYAIDVVCPTQTYTVTFTDTCSSQVVAADGASISFESGYATVSNTNGGTWANIQFDHAALDLSSQTKGFSIRVKGPRQSKVSYKLQVGDEQTNNIIEKRPTEFNYTNTNQWQTIAFDFTDQTATDKTKTVIFFDAEDAASTDITDDVFMIDDIAFGEHSALSTQKGGLVGLSIYPNPVSNRVSISAAESIDRMRIYDLTGKLVKQASPHKAAFSVDVSGLSKGVYLVKLNAGDREATTKMIK